MNASTSSRLVLQQEDTIHILTVKKSWDGRLKPLILISNVSKMSFFSIFLTIICSSRMVLKGYTTTVQEKNIHTIFIHQSFM